MQDIVKASLGLSNEMKFFDLETQVETLVGTVLLTGATSAATAPSQISNTRKQVFNQYRNNAADMLTTIKDSKALAQQQLEKAKQNGNKKAISRAELQLSQIESSAVYGMDLIKAINIAPDIMNDNQVDLLRQKVALLRQKENLRSNSVGKSEIDAKIADIDLQIENSSVTENKQLIKERTDANVKKLAADNNIGFKQAKDSNEALSVIKENNKRIAEENRARDKNNQIPLINEGDANGNGFIVQNADGSQDIVINEDVAGDNEAITTAQHEFFHGALFKTLQNNPGAISGMADGLRKEIATHYKNYEVMIYGDPAGDFRSQTDERTPFQIMRTYGLKAIPAPSNDVALRIEAVDAALQRLLDGKAGFLMDTKCINLKKGFNGGYHYRRLQTSGDRYDEKPLKNRYSHVHDALQYLMMGAGEGRTILSGKQTQKSVIAKKEWDVFAGQKKKTRKVWDLFKRNG